jgi:hypothetical protein
VTLLWSTLIAISAYLFMNELPDPLRLFRGVRWKTSTVILIHENVLANDDMSSAEAKRDIRSLAVELQSAYMQIRLAGALTRMRLIPSEDAVARGITELIGLSYGTKSDENREGRHGKIRIALKII